MVAAAAVGCAAVPLSLKGATVAVAAAVVVASEPGVPNENPPAAAAGCALAAGVPNVKPDVVVLAAAAAPSENPPVPLQRKENILK